MDALRRRIQILWFFLTNGSWTFPFTGALYQGPLKVLCSPGLNCYSCPAATSFCPLGTLQQLLLGLRLGVQSGQYFFGFYVLGWMGILGVTFGRLICGWVCPFGLLQELLYRIPLPKRSLWPPLRWGKYLCLVLLVIVLPLVAVDSLGLGQPWFCKYLCPAGTLEAGLPMLALDPDLRTLIGWLFLSKLGVLLMVLVGSAVVNRFFCRTLCPLGAFYGLFNGKSLMRLKFHADACTKCGACHSVCPVDLRFNKTPQSPECIGCLRCLTHGCHSQAIRLDVAGLTCTVAPASSCPSSTPHPPAL